MYQIKAVSAVNLRGSRSSGGKKTLDEPLKFRCSYCGRLLKLGANEFVLTKITYMFGELDFDTNMCSRCSDVFADIIRFGPRTLNEGHKWELRSKLMKISAVYEDLACPMCAQRMGSNIFIKCDNLAIPGRKEYPIQYRVCARCAIVYLLMMKKHKKVLLEGKWKFHEASFVKGENDYGY